MTDRGTPKSWERIQLGKVATVERGISWSREQESAVPLGGALPVVRIGNVQQAGFRMDNTLYLREVSERERAHRTIGPSTLVMVGSNGNRDRVGNVFLATPQVTGHLLASFLISINASECVSERFLAACLRSDRNQSRITEATAGSTGLKNLSLGWLRGLNLDVPPLPEQRAIAAILDSIDEAIERAEEVIAATEELRKALLQDLLTHGVPGWHKEWKHVPGIGTIPADWEVTNVGTIARFASGSGMPASEFNPKSTLNPIPVYGGNGISGYTSAPLVQEPVVVIGRVGQKCGSVHHTNNPAWITDNALYSKGLLRDTSIPFLALLLERSRLNDIRNRNDLPLLNQSIVHGVMMAIPNNTEQDAIMSLANTVEMCCGEERAILAEVRFIKQAVSEALLSGRVRVVVSVGVAGG